MLDTLLEEDKMAVKKDYEIIAGILRQEYARYCVDEIDTLQVNTRGRLVTSRIALNIADYFASNSKWFNRNTFLDACGIEG